MPEKKRYTTGEFAKKAGVSIRTIHHYNDKGLIAPTYVSEAGYRYYSEADFGKLQKILSLKYLGFSLEEIREISLKESDADFLRQSLSLQLDLIHKKIQHMQMVEEALQETAQDAQKMGTVDWEAMPRLMQLVGMENDLVEQYKNGENIKSRINLHERYSHNKQGWFPWIFSHLEKIPAKDILEIGCGNGMFWKSCETNISAEWKIVLTDISNGMLEDAAKNLDSNRFQYLRADCQKLPFQEKSFDLVIANFVLFYPRKLKDALSEIHRVLRQGGVLICATYGKNHMKEIEQLVKGFDSDINLSRVKLYENFGLENGAEILREFFDDIQMDEYPDYLDVPAVEPIMDYILSCHGNQREQLVPKYNQFHKYLEKQMQKKQTIKITKQAGIFIARK